jgi:activator of HSP90 ATPase
MAIHQEVVIDATPNRIYRALTDETEFQKVSGGAPTQISREEGGPFSCFGGMILGRQLELQNDRWIVQAWRVKMWEPGLYSCVRFELRPQGSKTTVILDHTGFPEDHQEHLGKGWDDNYWKPLRAYLLER